MVRLVVAMGTLLGPEETITRVGVPLWGAGGVFFRAIEPRFTSLWGGSGWGWYLPGMTWAAYRGRWSGWCCWVVVGWSLVENCTVDASIFVVKLSRANGGCLGTRSR